MNGNSGKITLEQGLYAIALLLALLLRLLYLGQAPLADLEAGWALQALSVARGEPELLGPQPGYILLTGFLFFIFGSSTELARLLPAISGSLLVLAPYLLRHRLGRTAGLVLAFGLAVDPGLVALSRQANALMLAVVLVLFTIVFWLNNRPVVAGIFAGLSLLSGPSAIAGWISIALAFGVARAFGWLNGGDERIKTEYPQEFGARTSGALRIGLLAAGTAILLMGTLYLRFPGGIGALAEALPVYLRGWTQPAVTSSFHLLTALVGYHLWPLTFGLVAAGRGWTAGWPISRWLSLWLLVALGVALVYPARQVADLVWPLIPLWMLAAVEFTREISWDTEEGWTSLGLAALILVFLAYIWLNFSAMSRVLVDPQAAGARWQLIGGAAGLIVVSTAMIGVGWSWQVARRGLVWALTVFLGFYTLGSAWGMLAMPERRAQELWYPQPTTIEEDLLLETVGDLSEWSTGRRDGIEIVLLGDSPSLSWSLRNFSNFRSEVNLIAGSLPAVVITQQQDEPQLAAAYRGTDFQWRESLGWSGGYPDDGLRWVISRQGPTIPEYIILWARNDLFIDGGSEEPES